jgi:3-isopropylmalate dehydrogenase
LIPGDGIGPDVVAEAVKTLDAVASKFGHSFEYQEAMMGGCAIDAFGDPLPDAELAKCLDADAVLLGAVGGPKWDNPTAPVRPEGGLLKLRAGMQTFANIRPVKPHPLVRDAAPIKPEILEGTDFIVIRELTGGIYFGKPSGRSLGPNGREAVDTCAYTEEEVRRVVRVGFEMARGRRKKLTSADKANVMSSSRLWREIATETATEYPDVQLEHVLADALSMYLMLRPSTFDVIVADNLFGDILTDEAAVLAGSMGMMPSASLGAVEEGKVGRRGLYEPIHGSAPDIAGQDKANPIATILSAAMLLRYSLGCEAEAKAVEAAVDNALAGGARTGDLAKGGETVLGTKAMGDRIADEIKNAR